MGSSSPLHIILFPFMSKGHTIPLLHLANLLHRHRPTAVITVVTTTANEAFISLSLSSLPPHLLTIISLPFPTTPQLPLNVESTDQLPSISLFTTFVNILPNLQTPFETALDELRHSHRGSTILISDGFLHWTQDTASKFGIPRLAFYGMSSFAQTICRLVVQHGTLLGAEHDDELLQVPDFPWIRITRNDFEHPFNSREPPQGPLFDFIVKCGIATSKSYGLLMNGFYELESMFMDYWNSRFEPKCWPIGPFCLAEEPKCEKTRKPVWVEWLDQKLTEAKPVLYIAFGSQVEISNDQLREIIIGLEKSEVDFLWALRIKPKQEEIMDGFQDKVKGRGLVVRGWVGQREVLAHQSVEGFLSHCGWNSVIESICAGVPILAWPMMAEQHLNARMVVEEMKIGLRVETCDGSVRGFVKGCGLSKMVKELMKGEKGEAIKKRVKELKLKANKAIQEGGSSWRNMELLLNVLETRNIISHNDNGMISNENGSTPTLNIWGK